MRWWTRELPPGPQEADTSGLSEENSGRGSGVHDCRLGLRVAEVAHRRVADIDAWAVSREEEGQISLVGRSKAAGERDGGEMSRGKDGNCVYVSEATASHSWGSACPGRRLKHFVRMADERRGEGILGEGGAGGGEGEGGGAQQKGKSRGRRGVRGEKCRFGSSRGCIIVASVIIALMLATTSGQVVDDTVTDRELLLARSGSNTGANYNFAEEKTVAIDGDTLAVGSFLNTPSCAGSSDGGRTVAGCILDYRMAEQLVAWFGEYDWTFAYSGSANGWTEAAFQTAIGSYNAQPTISVAYNYQTGGSDSGAYVFGGYTTQSWSRINRCADSGNGGTGSVDACNWWDTCANQAACNTYNACSCTVNTGGSGCATLGTCGTGGGGSDCTCCTPDPTCTAVCGHVADSDAALFTLMSNDAHSFNKYASDGGGYDIFTCDTYGPSFGAKATTPGEPPYDDTGFALRIDLTNQQATYDNYGYSAAGSQWAKTGVNTLSLEEFEVFALGSRTQYRSLFHFSPSGFGSTGDGSVHVFYRNKDSGAFSANAWGHLKQITLPSFLDKYLYGWSVALDVNTLVVGRRGNRDIYIHERHRSDCTHVGSFADGPLCADHGAGYSADAWGVVQTLSWPGSSLSTAWTGETTASVYGGVQEQGNALTCTAAQSLTLCVDPGTTPTLVVGEWGVSVDLSGDWLIVGAYKSTQGANTRTGAAFVYQRTGATGDFMYKQALVGVTAADSHCGWDVAISGNYAIVGCYGSTAVAGSVAFYENEQPDGSSGGTPAYGQNNNGGWSLFATRTAEACTNPPSCTTTSSDSAADDYFGYSVDICSTTAIVGAWNLNTQAGAAYIYERNWHTSFSGATSTMWQISKKLVAPDTASGLYFGFKVAIDGGYALVTATKNDDGRGYLFGRNYGGLNNWGYIDTLSQPAVGGTPGYNTNLGAVGQILNYWADGGGDHSNALQKAHGVPYWDVATSTGTGSSPGFGRSGGLSGNTAVIGSPFGDTALATDTGTVSLFSVLPVHTNIAPQMSERVFQSSDAATGDAFGHGVAVTSDSKLLAVGAPFATANAVIDAGAVYVYKQSPNGSPAQIAKLAAASPTYRGRLGWSVASLLLERGDGDEADQELLVGAPGHNNVDYPAYPLQDSSNQRQDRSGAVLVFTRSPQWATSTLSSGIAASATSITVANAQDLMGASTTGVISLGMNTVTVTGVNFGTNVLTASPGVTYAVSAGAVATAKLYSDHPTGGFREVEKLTAQSTSCGQGGTGFQAVFNQYSGTNTHVSDYSSGVTLIQDITVSGTPDEEICVSSAADLLGALYTGGTAPITPGDPDDVIMWIKIGDGNTNPAVAIKNTMTLGTCATGATNNWGATLTGDLIKVVSSTLVTAESAGVYVYAPPYYSLATPYPSCFDSEYITTGQVHGAESTVTVSASGGTSVTATEFSGGYAYAVGASTINVKNPSQLFLSPTFGLVSAGTSTTTFALASTASSTAGYYLGYDITVDLDGVPETTSDVETRSIVGYSSSRVVSVDSAFTSAPTTSSIYHISRWQTRPYITTGYNPIVTVSGVNFITGVISVSGGIVSAGYAGEAVRLTVPSGTQISLDPTGPIVPDLYVRSSIHIVQGRGAGQSRVISAYDGYSKVATVSLAWVIWPDSTSQYVVTGKKLCINDCKDDMFGSAVSTGVSGIDDRHVMAVGAPNADSHSYCVTRADRGRTCSTYQTPLYQSGRVYLYERQENVTKHRWKLVQILEAPTVGNTLNTQGDAGPGSYLELLKSSQSAHEAASYDHFGTSVAVQGDSIYVGAPNSGTGDSGAVFVFERGYHVFMRDVAIDCTVCSTTQFCMAVVPASEPYTQSPIPDYYVGYSVTIGDETRVVSGYTISGGGGTAGYGEGGRPVFTVSKPFSFTVTNVMTFTMHSGSAGTRGLMNKWGFKQLIVPSAPSASDLFGYSIAISANVLVVGAPGDDMALTNLVNEVTDAGAVYIFQRNAGLVDGREQKRWTEMKRLTQSSSSQVETNVRTRLGQSVAIDKQAFTIVAGAPMLDAKAYRPGQNYVQSQTEGAIPAAGGVAVFRRRDERTTTTVTADFAVGATSISVLSAADLLGTDTVSTICIGQNVAIEVTGVTGNTLTVTAETVMFANTHAADSRPNAVAARVNTWFKDRVYSSSQGVAGGGFGEAVSLWDSGVLLVGAPRGETEVGTSGSVQNIGTRAGTAHLLQVSRLNSTLDYYGYSENSGTVAAVVSTTVFTLAQSASNRDGAYVHWKLSVGSETKNILKYSGTTRQATIDSAFATTPTADSSSYVVTNPATFTKTVNSELYPGQSCTSLLGEGYNNSGYYWLRTRFTNDTGLRAAFVGYCDQETDGGGWLMCYTDDDDVDMATEYGYSAAHPYATEGYRSDCRNVAFNEVMYVRHSTNPSMYTEDPVIFRAEGRRPIVASDTKWDGNPVSDVYGKLIFTAYSPLTGPDRSTSYQLLACGGGHGTGLFMSGLKATSTCADGWKTCSSWCNDQGSDYFRMAFSPRANYMYTTNVNFTGVAFRENGHREMPRRLVSAGIRAVGPCQSGWQTDGAYCTCPMLYPVRSQVVYWRFEEGVDDSNVVSTIHDQTGRDSAKRSDHTSTLVDIGTGGVHTTSVNNDLEFVTATVPSYSVYAPQNATFASLCLHNEMSVEFSGAQMLRTTEYATMNSKSFTAFTWEVSVYFKSLTGAQTILTWSNSAGDKGMTLSKTSSHTYQFTIVHASGTVTATSVMALDAEKWYHLAVTYDGGPAGHVRVYHANTHGSSISSSDCVDSVCMIGAVYGTIGKIGSGLTEGLALGTGTMAGCSVGDTISASGGGICSAGYVGADCAQDSDCGLSGTCALGSGFAATITAVSGGAITQVYITNPGVAYMSTPSLVISTAACTCGGAAGNVAGNFASCMTVVTTKGERQLKSRQWVNMQTAAVPWASMDGWASNGDTSACTPSSTEPCPWVSVISSENGWRWIVGQDGAGATSMNGFVDEVRIHSEYLDLSRSSLWRP